MQAPYKYVFAVIGTLLLLAVLWYLRTYVAYLLVAGIISIIGRPLVVRLNQIKIGKFYIPNAVSALLTLIVIVLVVAGAVSLFIPLVASQAQVIAQINVDSVLDSLHEPIAQIELLLQQYQFTSENIFTTEWIKSKLSGLISVADVSDVLNGLVGALGNVFIAAFSILFISFFFLKDLTLFKKIILSLAPKQHKSRFESVLSSARKLFARYFVGVLIQLSLITFLVSLGLHLFGVESALLIGFIAGLINVIPYVGPIIGIAVGLTITLTSNIQADFYLETIPLLSKVLGVFLTVQLLDNFVFQPFIFSNSVNAHPLEIFFVILIAGKVYGIPGMILAVPLYTLIRIIAKEFLNRFELVQSLTKNI